MTPSQRSLANWDAIYEAMRAKREALAQQKKIQETQTLAATAPEQGSTARAKPALRRASKVASTDVSYHDDSKERWDQAHNGPQLLFPGEK